MPLNATTLAAGMLTAGLLVGGWTVLQPTSDSSVPEGPPTQALASTQPFDGIQPIEEVVAFWQQRVDAAPLGALDRTQLGVALTHQARAEADLTLYAEAEDVLVEALQLNPDSDTTQLALGQALHAQHDFSRAAELARAVLDADPSSLSALALLGDAHLELGDYGLARRHYRELFAREASAPVVSRLSRLALATGDPDAALAHAEDALGLAEDLALRPTDSAFYWFQLGHVRFEVGDVDGAVAALDQALVIEPEHPGALETLAHVSASAGDTERAEALYRSLIVSSPAADLHGALANLLRARGADDEAVEQERLALDLAMATIDSFPAERRHLAGFLTLRDSALAVELAEQDLAQRHDGGAFETLAWALFHDGRLVEADAAIRSALSTGAVDASLEYRAAAIAYALGDDVRAEEHVREALRINPRFDFLEAADAAELLNELER